MRLEATRKADLAAKAMVVLGRAATRLKGAELAGQLGATASFMPQVLGPLVERGWIRSEPGPNGGYTLAVDLDEVSVLEVIEAIDGPTDRGRCVADARGCDPTTPCTLHFAWEKARTALRAELRTTPLSALPDPVPRSR